MKKNNGKKDINKNKIIIALCAIVLLLLVIVGVVVLANKINNREKDKAGENAPTAKAEEEMAKDLLYNNYLISYILEGDVEIGEGKLNIEGNPTTYYAVTDPLLADIHSIGDIYDLIDNDLTAIAAVRARKLMQSEYANQYTSRNDVLYVSKIAEPCEIYEGGPLDKSKMKYRVDGDSVFAVYDNIPYMGLYDDDNKLKADTLWFACSKAFSNTKTDKDDIYNPNANAENNNAAVDPNINGDKQNETEED